MSFNGSSNHTASIAAHQKWVTQRNELADLTTDDWIVLALVFGFGSDVAGVMQFAKRQQAKANFVAAQGDTPAYLDSELGVISGSY